MKKCNYQEPMLIITSIYSQDVVTASNVGVLDDNVGEWQWEGMGFEG